MTRRRLGVLAGAGALARPATVAKARSRQTGTSACQLYRPSAAERVVPGR